MKGMRASLLFCEDIREESGGTASLIGVMPDVMNLPNFPIGFQKFAIYLRLSVQTNAKAETITINFRSPGIDQPQLLQTIEREVIEQAQKDAVERKMPYAGVTGAMLFQGFVVREPGTILVELQVGDEAEVIGVLNIRQAPSSGEPPSPLATAATTVKRVTT